IFDPVPSRAAGSPATPSELPESPAPCSASVFFSEKKQIPPVVLAPLASGRRPIFPGAPAEGRKSPFSLFAHAWPGAPNPPLPGAMPARPERARRQYRHTARRLASGTRALLSPGDAPEWRGLRLQTESFAATALPRGDPGARAGGTARQSPSSGAPLHECARVRLPPIAILLLELPAPQCGSFHPEVYLVIELSLESQRSPCFARSPASPRAGCSVWSDSFPSAPRGTAWSLGLLSIPQSAPGTI